METRILDTTPSFIPKHSEREFKKIRNKLKFKRFKLKLKGNHKHDWNNNFKKSLRKDESLKIFKLPTRKYFEFSHSIELIERRYKKTKKDEISDYDFYEQDLLRRFKKSKFISLIYKRIYIEKNYSDYYDHKSRYYKKNSNNNTIYDIIYNIPKKPKKMKEKCFKKCFRK